MVACEPETADHAADQFGAGSRWRVGTLCSGSVHDHPGAAVFHFLRNCRAAD